MTAETRRNPIVGVAIIAIMIVVGAFLFRPKDRPGPAAPATARRVSEFQWVIPRKQRDDYFADLAKAARQVTLQPVSDGSKDGISRLVVFQVEQPGPAHDAGFRKGDVVVQVNGAPIRTMSRALNLIHEVRTSDHLTVQIRRGEKLIDYRFDVE